MLRGRLLLLAAALLVLGAILVGTPHSKESHVKLEKTATHHAYRLRPAIDELRASRSAFRHAMVKRMRRENLRAQRSKPRRQHTISGQLESSAYVGSTVWDRLAQCESGGNWQDTAGGFEGGLQFLNSTWLANGGEQFASHAYLATREEQIAIAEKVLAASGWGQWPVCSRELGLS